MSIISNFRNSPTLISYSTFDGLVELLGRGSARIKAKLLFLIIK
jgi:hypothetical protein